MFIQEMTSFDCFRVFAQARFGRLACARDNQPYIVPICFVCQGSDLYGFTTPGQKVEWMRTNPLVCVEVDEIDGSKRWASALAFGRYEELPEAADWKDELLRAHKLLREHAGWWDPAWAARTDRDPVPPLDFIVYRIHIDRVTGRQAMPDEEQTIPTTESFAAGANPGWFRRALRFIIPARGGQRVS